MKKSGRSRAALLQCLAVAVLFALSALSMWDLYFHTDNKLFLTGAIVSSLVSAFAVWVATALPPEEGP